MSAPPDPALALLTGADAGDLLGAAVATAGGELVGWRARQVDHRPGASTTVSYRVRVRWGDRVQDETLEATTGVADVTELAPGGVLLGDGEHRVGVWRFPLDPFLPALPIACDRRRVAQLLASFGVPGVAADGANVHLRVRAYRPRRRAVVEVSSPRGRLFVKVVKPQSVLELHRRHRLLHDAGVPVPRSLGWSDDGLLVLAALPGTPMRRRLRAGGPVPSAADLTDLLDQMPEAVLDLPRRAPWAEHARHYARVVGAAVPAEAARVGELAERIADGLAGYEPDVATHGDFYEGQLLLDGTAVTGLLDVDTAGPGRRSDDVACLLAHALVLTETGAADAGHLTAVATAWQHDAEQVLDPAELRRRVAGVLLSLATGPHRTQDDGWLESTVRRVTLVERWVEAADAGRRTLLAGQARR